MQNVRAIVRTTEFYSTFFVSTILISTIASRPLALGERVLRRPAARSVYCVLPHTEKGEARIDGDILDDCSRQRLLTGKVRRSQG